MKLLNNVEKFKLFKDCTRPTAGSGLWVASLLPVALLVNTLRHNVSDHYRCLTLLSWMIFGDQCLILNGLSQGRGSTGWSGLIAGIIASLSSLLIGQSLIIAAAAGLLVTFVVQWLFIGLLRGLTKSFTFGEAAVVSQGLALFLFKSVCFDLPRTINWTRAESPRQRFVVDDELSITVIIEWGVLMVLLLIGAMHVIGHRIRNVIVFSVVAGLAILLIIATPITDPLPIVFVLEFFLNDPEKILVLIIFMSMIAATAGFCYWHLQSKRRTSTVIRKSFHLVIVLVFLVGIIYQRLVLYLGAGVAFSFLLLLEAIRIAKVDYVSSILDDTVKSFVDAQDSGIVALTPIYLLVGGAAPLFLSSVALTTGSQAVLPLLSGVLSVGVGDSFAGLVGSLYGRHLWSDSKKSIEGTVANATSQLVTIGLLFLTGLLPLWSPYPKYLICITGVITNAIVEAKTDQVDNLIVPLVTFVIFSWI